MNKEILESKIDIDKIEIDKSIKGLISELNTIKRFKTYSSCSGLSTEHSVLVGGYLCWYRWTEQEKFDEEFYKNMIKLGKKHNYYVTKSKLFSFIPQICAYISTRFSKEGKAQMLLTDKEKREKWKQLREDIFMSLKKMRLRKNEGF